MKIRLLPSGLAVLLLLTAVGCKKKVVEAGEKVITEKSAVAALNTEQRKDFCETLDAARKETPEDECRRRAFQETISGLTPEASDTTVRELCKTSYDACLRSPPSATRGESRCASRQMGPECTATMGEVQLCLAAITGARKESLAKIPTCTEVTLAAVKDQPEKKSDDNEVLALAPCQALHSKCAKLFR
jgi:hypothetical protein